MRQRRLVFSDAAIADILEQADWYATQSGTRLARHWETAVTSTISRILRRPALGPACKFRSPAIEGLRRATISKFSRHLLFYRFDDDEVFVIRIVHGARDLERLFS
jgi:toxin ParE1/3/4